MNNKKTLQGYVDIAVALVEVCLSAGLFTVLDHELEVLSRADLPIEVWVAVLTSTKRAGCLISNRKLISEAFLAKIKGHPREHILARFAE